MEGKLTSDAEHGPCSCREWVKEEVARLRADLAGEIRTRKVFVGKPGNSMVEIGTTKDSASVQVQGPDGRLHAQLLAATFEGSTIAGVSIGVTGGNVVDLTATETLDQFEGRLVFDDPDSDDEWTVIDRTGIHKQS